ncbi:NIL domain protein, partial [Chlamydia psittaci 06-1683]
LLLYLEKKDKEIGQKVLLERKGL